MLKFCVVGVVGNSWASLLRLEKNLGATSWHRYPLPWPPGTKAFGLFAFPVAVIRVQHVEFQLPKLPAFKIISSHFQCQSQVSTKSKSVLARFGGIAHRCRLPCIFLKMKNTVHGVWRAGMSTWGGGENESKSRGSQNWKTSKDSNPKKTLPDSDLQSFSNEGQKDYKGQGQSGKRTQAAWIRCNLIVQVNRVKEPSSLERFHIKQAVL